VLDLLGEYAVRGSQVKGPKRASKSRAKNSRRFLREAGMIAKKDNEESKN